METLCKQSLADVLKTFRFWLKNDNIARLVFTGFGPKSLTSSGGVQLMETGTDFAYILVAQYLKKNAIPAAGWMTRLLAEIGCCYAMESGVFPDKPTPEHIFQIVRLLDSNVIADSSIRQIVLNKLINIYSARGWQNLSVSSTKNKKVFLSICSGLTRRLRNERNKAVRALLKKLIKTFHGFQDAQTTLQASLLKSFSNTPSHM